MILFVTENIFYTFTENDLGVKMSLQYIVTNNDN